MKYITDNFGQIPLKTELYDLTHAELVETRQIGDFMTIHKFISGIHSVEITSTSTGYSICFHLLNTTIKHREDKPSYMNYDRQTNKLVEYQCFIQNEMNDINDFYSDYYNNMHAGYEVFTHKIDGVTHNCDGPAEIYKYHDRTEEHYYLYGDRINKSHYDLIINGIKNETFKPTDIDNLTLKEINDYKSLAIYYNKQNMISYFDGLYLMKKMY